MNSRLHIRQGRKVGYWEYNRLWDKFFCKMPTVDVSAPATFISPNGSRWRLCGLHYPGMLLVKEDFKYGHSVSFGTLYALVGKFGWGYLPDTRKEEKPQITRWPDGNHYYLDGDDSKKYNTYSAAYRAWLRKISKKV